MSSVLFAKRSYRYNGKRTTFFLIRIKSAIYARFRLPDPPILSFCADHEKIIGLFAAENRLLPDKPRLHYGGESCPSQKYENPVMPDYAYEKRFGRKDGKIICGVDEVGRGPLAGPVVAAAAILPHDFPRTISRHIQDSKKLSAADREDLYRPLTQLCRYAIAEATVEEIDRLNILWASMLAMQRAVRLLGAPLDVALVDGNRCPPLPCAAFPVVAGDDKSLSIAAASIIAKVYRDRLMRRLAETFPFYGWDHNVGYGTTEHLTAITRHGITEWHRMSFTFVRETQEKARGNNPLLFRFEESL